MALARTSEAVYNLARASLIAARAHTAYLIPLGEAWTTALECARLLQQHCRVWFSMAEACLTGLTTHQGEAVGRIAREAFYALHARPDSRWNLVPWKTELPKVLPPPEVVTERVHVADQHELRELRNVLERAWALSGPNASFRELRLWLDPQAAQGQLSEVVDTALPFKEAKERWNDQFEKRYVASVFGANGQNVTRAAEHAGLSRRHFRELLYKHGIVERPSDDSDE